MNAHVHLDGIGGAQRGELLFLNHAQQLDLGFRADGADLIEENGAVVGDFEVSLLGLNGAGKGAPHVAEQGGFQQVRRQRAAVDGHEHLLARGELAWMALATSSLPVPVSPVIRMVERLEATWATRSSFLHHALALADDIGEAVALLQGALEVGILVLQAPGRDHAVDFDDELFVVPGLGEIVVGAQLEGLDGGFHRAVGGDHEDGRLAVVRAHVLQHLHAGTVGHHQIEKHQVVAVRSPCGGALRWRWGRTPPRSRRRSEASPGFREYPARHRLPEPGLWRPPGRKKEPSFQAAFTGFLWVVLASGISSRKRAPPPGRLTASIEPPCS